MLLALEYLQVQKVLHRWMGGACGGGISTRTWLGSGCGAAGLHASCVLLCVTVRCVHLRRDIKTGNIFLTAAGDVQVRCAPAAWVSLTTMPFPQTGNCLSSGSWGVWGRCGSAAPRTHPPDPCVPPAPQLGDFGLATYRETEGDRPEDMNLVVRGVAVQGAVRDATPTRLHGSGRAWTLRPMAWVFGKLLGSCCASTAGLGGKAAAELSDGFRDAAAPSPCRAATPRARRTT